MSVVDSMDFGTASIERHLRAGLAAFAVPEPKTLDRWAQDHFYLSAESSYVEQSWTPWPFQRAILSCLSNDDIREVILRKSARVGYTKMILAAIGYFAEHKRRSQAIWQPNDGRIKVFVKTELDPMLRDVKVMDRVFPENLKRHKNNTLEQKFFLGSVLHTLGGTAKSNYESISVDVGYLDEFDKFDHSIEGSGDPGALAAKRVEGATFPKMVFGSTPLHEITSNIRKRERTADLFMEYHIPCPECHALHPLTWGGKEEPHGMKWRDDDPQTVRHLCPHCGALIDQAQYLEVADHGVLRAEDGTTCDVNGVFRDATGNIQKAPEKLALHVWSAYSPNVSWKGLVEDFFTALREKSEGKKELLQQFVNETLGEYWTEDYQKNDQNELMARAEPFPLELVPAGCLLLFAGVDTHDNRLECNVWGYGRGCETWTIADRVFYGNPDENALWDELSEFLFETEFDHASGAKLKIHATAIDSGGHFTQAVYRWVEEHQHRNVFAIRGTPGREKAIRDGSRKIEQDHKGRVRKRGLMLWHVGTNKAKDVLHNRLQIEKPGPGYIHFSADLSERWFKQYTAEVRVPVRTQNGMTGTRWECPSGRRNEKWDCAVYCVWLEEGIRVSSRSYGLAKAPAKFWDDLEARVLPKTRDLFAAVEEVPADEPVSERPPKARQRQIQSGAPVGRDEWASRL